MDGDTVVIVVVIVVMVICAMNAIIISIFAVVYCIKKDKYPRINKDELFYMRSYIHTRIRV